MSVVKDLCIVGTGPAGLTAAVYAARYKVDQVLVGELDGGLMSSSHKICNYPSEIDISGMDLTEKMLANVRHLGVPQKFGSIIAIDRDGDKFKVEFSSKETILAKQVILATGTTHRHLGLEREEELTGKGVSYCATCDAMFYAGKTVAVVGGSDSANTAALYLARVAEKVYQIYRGDQLRGEVAWIDQVKQHPKIELLYNTDVTKLNGVERLESVELSQELNGSKILKLDGLFIEAGSKPDMTLIHHLGLETDEAGYIKTASNQATSQAGVWAAGDITTNSDSFRQIVTACAEGAIAARSVYTHLQKNS